MASHRSALVSLLDNPAGSVGLSKFLTPRERRNLLVLCHDSAQSTFREQYFAASVWTLPPSHEAAERLVKALSPATRSFVTCVAVRTDQPKDLLASLPMVKSVRIGDRLSSNLESLADKTPLVDLSGPWPSSLTTLDLRDASIKDALPLAKLELLQELHLPCLEASICFSALKTMTKLRILSVELANVDSNSSLEFLRGMSELRELSIKVKSCANGSALSLVALGEAQFQHLQTLKIGGPIKVTGLQTAIEASDTSLTTLECCCVHFEDAETDTLMDSLAKKKLEGLTLYSCESVTPSMLIKLLPAGAVLSSSLMRLDIRGIELENLDFLSTVSQLEDLALDMTEELDWSPLSNLQKLKRLDQNGDCVEDAPQFDVLTELPCLSTLVSPVAISNDDCLPEATKLVVRTTDEDLCPDIGDWPKLETIRYMGAGHCEFLLAFPSATLMHLTLVLDYPMELSYIDRLTKLRSLRVMCSREEGCDDEDFSFLGSLPLLEVLELPGEPIATLEMLCDTPRLTRLWLKETRVQDITPLSALVSLESVDLRGTKVTDLAPLRELASLKRVEVTAGSSVVNFESLRHSGVLVVSQNSTEK